MSRRVVITGIGTLNACSIGRDNFWKSALDRRTGISEVKQDEFGPIPVKSYGRIQDFQPSEFIQNRKSLKVMCRDIQMAVVASYLARQDSGLGDGVADPERSGICMGEGLFDHDLEELSETLRHSIDSGEDFDERRFGQEGMSYLFPLWLLKYLPNMPACHISIAHNLQGPSNTLTEDGSGSAAAIEEATHVIQRDMADIMFCGGAESHLNATGLLRPHALGILNPNGSSDRPYPVFSKSGAGLVMGEGGAILILEELEHARKRNARIYAEIVGVSSCTDWKSKSGPAAASESRVAVMFDALGLAKITPEAVDAIHLSANGIREEDIEESLAIQELFGKLTAPPKLVRTKSLTGYMGFAAASTETSLAAMSLKHGRLVPSGSNEDSLLKDPFTFAGKNTGRSPLRYLLVNQFTKGLCHHSIVLKTLGSGS